MDKDLIGLLIALIGVTGGLGLPFFVIYYQNRERRALIEKGMDPNLIYPWSRARGEKKGPPTSQGPMLWGSLLTGIGLGILAGYLVAHFSGFPVTVMINGFALLCGGLGLIVYERYRKKHGKKAD